MITDQEFYEALKICMEYQQQVNKISEEVNEKLNLLNLNKNESNFSSLKLDSEISKMHYISGKLKSYISNYSHMENIEIKYIRDIKKIDLARIKKYRGFGNKCLNELITIIKVCGV